MGCGIEFNKKNKFMKGVPWIATWQDFLTQVALVNVFSATKKHWNQCFAMSGSIKAYTPPTCATALSFKTSRHSWETATTNPYHLISTAFIQRWPMSLQHFKREEWWCQHEVLIAHGSWLNDHQLIQLYGFVRRWPSWVDSSAYKHVCLIPHLASLLPSNRFIRFSMHVAWYCWYCIYSRSEVQILAKDLG